MVVGFQLSMLAAYTCCILTPSASPQIAKVDRPCDTAVLHNAWNCCRIRGHSHFTNCLAARILDNRSDGTERHTLSSEIAAELIWDRQKTAIQSAIDVLLISASLVLLIEGTMHYSRNENHSVNGR